MRHFARTSFFMILTIVVGVPQRTLGDELDNHPALRLFPSPEEWRQRIASAMQHDAEAFAIAQRDLDFAVRSAALLEGERPLLMEETRERFATRPIIRKAHIWTHENLELHIRTLADSDEAKALKNWLQVHFDELAVADSELLRLVLADVLLNGWNDWSAWTGKSELDALRADCAQPHVYYAWELAAQLQATEYNGLGLRWIIHPSDGSNENREKMLFLLKGAKEVAVIDYLLKAANQDLPDWARRDALTVAVAIGPAPADIRALLAVWSSSLSSTRSDVRSAAVLATGKVIRAIRIYTKGQDNNETLQSRLQQLADTDLDNEVRIRAKHAIKSISEAQWSEDP